MEPSSSFEVGKIRIGGNAPLFLIAGPCVIESEAHATSIATRLAEIAGSVGIPLIFKASYDKANRSSIESFRGPGLDAGLRVLAKIKKRTGLPILTDVHEIGHVGPAAEVCDVLQIPAFLSRQTDLLVAVGRSGRAANIKKGQFLSPWDVANAVGKDREHRQSENHSDGKRRILRLPESCGGHAIVSDYAQTGLSGGLRCDARGAIARRRRKLERRPARVHRTARARGNCSRHRRVVSRSARQSGESSLGRHQRASTRKTPATPGKGVAYRCANS